MNPGPHANADRMALCPRADVPLTARRSALARMAAAASPLVLPWPLLAQAAAEAAGLPHPASLAASLAAALAQRKALVVMVSLDGCPYCKWVRTAHLLPLRAEGQPVVQIEMGQPLALVDVRGQASSHRQVVAALGVRVAPTVLFLGRSGTEVAPRLPGVPLADFYGAYLQERVDAANRSVAG